MITSMARTMAAGLLAAATIAAAAPTPTGDALAKISFSYPEAAGRLPALKAWFDRQRTPFRAGVEGQARADAKAAAADGRTFIPYEASRVWKVVTETPRFLSLSVDRYDYTGGAHGMDTFGTIVWDKATARPLPALSFFRDAAALRGAIQRGFCQRLDAARRQRRGGDLGSSLDEFTKCIDPTKETVILGSTTHDRFDRIGILVAPYDAGPYAEGSYDVTLPVTPAIVAAVKPEWRGYFKVAGTP